MLVLARDSDQLKKVETQFRYGMEFAELTTALKNAAVVVEPWGRRSAVIVDREIGPLLKCKERVRALQLLETAMEADFTLNLASLSDEDRRVLLAQAPGVMVDPNFMKVPLHIGLVAQIDSSSQGRSLGE